MKKILSILKIPLVAISTLIIERSKTVSGLPVALYGPMPNSVYSDQNPLNIMVNSLCVLLLTIAAALIGVYFIIFRRKKNVKKDNKRR